MKSRVFLLFISLIFIGCSSTKNLDRKSKCPKIFKNKFSEIRNEKYITINGKDSTAFNEIRFECVYSSLYTHKVMYDKYGKWNKEIYPSNKKHPILMWENIDLFEDDKKYTVLTNGIEEWKHIYASVMIFDDENKDVLSKESLDKQKITGLFAEYLQNQDHKKKDFYEVYWKIVDPDKWKSIKGNIAN